MRDITVRPAELRDAPQIAKIHVKTWQCAYKGQIPDSYLDSLSVEKRTKSWEEILSKGDPDTQTFVVEEGGRILGFASAGVAKDKEMPHEIGELWAIYVDPDNMGRGVGSLLLKTSLAYLRELKFIKAVLWVLTSNRKTRDWYESKGWKVEGKTTIDVRDGFELHETRYIIDLITQDYKYSLETAIEANQKGKLFQWLQDYLRGEGGNKELADYLIQEKSATISLIEFPLSKLKRGAGPENEMPYIEAPEIWEKRVGLLVEKVKEGIKLPPLIVTDFGTSLGLSDGNHTHEALRRCGYDKYWTIFFFKNEESIKLLGL